MLRKMLLIVLLCIYFYHKIAFSVLDRPADLQLRSGIHGAALQPDGVWALLPERGHLQCHCWQPALLCLPARVHRGQVPVLWVISTNCSIWVPRKSSTRAKFKARVGDFYFFLTALLNHLCCWGSVIWCIQMIFGHISLLLHGQLKKEVV